MAAAVAFTGCAPVAEAKIRSDSAAVVTDIEPIRRENLMSVNEIKVRARDHLISPSRHADCCPGTTGGALCPLTSTTI
jgi:hypothetical protein